MACQNNNGKFFLGLLIGAVGGALATYFAERNKRESFANDLSSTLDRTRDSLVEGYYEAKDRYNEYRNRLSNRSADIIADVQREVEDLD